MQLGDMWYQVDYCSQMLSSLKRIKCYDCMSSSSSHFGYECTPAFDEFIISDTYKDGNNKELLEYIVYEGSHELLQRIIILTKSSDSEDLERAHEIMEYIVDYCQEHLSENAIVESNERCKTVAPETNHLQEAQDEFVEDEEHEEKEAVEKVEKEIIVG